MKILHLISSGGLFGAENIVLTLARNFNRDGDVATVGAIQDKRNLKSEIIEKAKAENLPTFVLKGYSRFDPTMISRLKRFLQERHIDILHTHNYKSDIIGCMGAKRAGIPVVATAHGYTDMTHKVTLYEKWDRWILKRFFDRVIVVTDKVLSDFPSDKKHIIPNGLDMDNFFLNKEHGPAVRKKYKINEGDIVIGTVGRLSKEKNQRLLLEAFEAIVREQDHVRLIIVGDGPERKNLNDFVQAKHLQDKVIFTGILIDLPPVYTAMDIFVLSSLTEGVPLTILEAMASGLPVVASNVGGIPEILENNKNGLLAKSQDKDDFVEKMQLLLRDKGLSQRLARAGYEDVRKKFSCQQMCREYRKTYEEVLK